MPQCRVMCSSLNSTLQTTLQGSTYRTRTGVRLEDFECNREWVLKKSLD